MKRAEYIYELVHADALRNLHLPLQDFPARTYHPSRLAMAPALLHVSQLSGTPFEFHGGIPGLQSAGC
jgi:hypothetical protein